MSERSIFEAAIEKDSPGERAAYLDAACGQNAKLRDRVELLLRQFNAPDPFLDAPPSELAIAARRNRSLWVQAGHPAW